MPFETHIVAPSHFDNPEDAEFIFSKIRELAWPVILVQFDAMSGVEAQERITDINHELAARNLPKFPPVQFVRGGFVDKRPEWLLGQEA